MMKTTFNLTAKSVVGFLFFFQKKGGNHAVAFPILFFYLCNCQGNGSCTTLADILDESVLFHPSSEIRTISRIRDKQRSSSPCMAICPSWAFPLLDVILSPRPPRRLLLLLHRTLGRPPGRGGKEASYRSITVRVSLHSLYNSKEKITSTIIIVAASTYGGNSMPKKRDRMGTTMDRTR